MNFLLIAIISGLIGMFGWAFADFFSAKSMKEGKLSESQACLFLYGATSLILWGVVILTKEATPSFALGDFLTLFVFAALNVVSYLMFFNALSKGTLGTISAIFSTYSVGSAVVSILFFGEQTNFARIISLLIVFAGIAAVSLQTIQKSELKVVKGLPQVLLAAGLLSLFFPFLDNFIASHNSVFFLVAIIDTLMTLLFGAYLLFQGSWPKITAKAVKISIYGGIVNAIGVLGLTFGLEKTDLTSVVVMISSAVPMVSAFLGFIFLKERLTKIQSLGIGLIVIGTIALFVS